MARIEWAMWANEQAMISCGVLCVGSILGVCSILLEFPHVRWEISIYGMILSLLILILEYPRGNRDKGNTKPRMNQGWATKVVSSLGVFGRNYFLRFVLYLLLCLPSLLQLATVMGGLCLIITAFIYLKAALENESWTPCKPQLAVSRSLTRPGPPSIAPPRFINTGRKLSPDGITYSNIGIVE